MRIRASTSPTRSELPAPQLRDNPNPLTKVNLVRRALLTWAIEATALAILAHVLPGVRVPDWQIALLAVLVIGALNAVLRPILVLFAQHLGILAFVGNLARLGRLPRTRPIVPGELAVSD